MYRDNTLIPTEAVRLLALGILATGERSYSELASEVRHFTGRIVGPMLGGYAMTSGSDGTPFIGAAAMMLLALVLFTLVRRRLTEGL